MLSHVSTARVAQGVENRLILGHVGGLVLEDWVVNLNPMVLPSESVDVLVLGEGALLEAIGL